MAVGAVEETITVTGESPVVDVQNTVQQRVIDREVIDTIPLSGSDYNMAAATTVPGVVASDPDVGRRRIRTAAPRRSRCRSTAAPPTTSS